MPPDPMPFLPRCSDADIEKVLNAAIPELRAALKAVMQDHQAIDSFDIANGTNSKTGVHTRYVCFVAHEFSALVLEGTARGIGASGKATFEMFSKLQKAG